MSSIGLWGRSMGAVTALMYCNEDPFISGIVIDSPFASLNVLIKELVNEQITLPSFIFDHAFKYVKDSVLEKAKFDINDIEPIKFVKGCCIPALFCYSRKDNFVPGHHCRELYEAYSGKKELIEINGDHNSIRPKQFKHAVYIFYSQTFYPVVLAKTINNLPKTVLKKRNAKQAVNNDELNRISENITNMINPLLNVKLNMAASKLVKPSIFDSSIVLPEDEYNEIFLNNSCIK